MNHPVTNATERPDSPVLVDAAVDWSAAYVHCPFCARVCPYCDFTVVEGRDDQTDRYVKALLAEIALEPEWRPLDSVNIGGGTPSRLTAKQLGSILSSLRDQFGLNDRAEVSLEANPEDWSPHFAKELVETGFNRVSFGVQSFDPEVLAQLGRRHTAREAEEAISAARRAGFRSINIDLIFGTPGESQTSWLAGLKRTVGLEPDHLSLYALTVERGTALSRAVAQGAPAPDPDRQADAYESALEVCRAAGLIHYEVSNWARSGHACVYNLITWAQGEYVAFGTGAHGHRAGVRRRNVRRLDAYLNRVEAGVRPIQGTETLDHWPREQERLIVGLRRRAGVTPGPVGDELLRSPAGDRLKRAGVLGLVDGRLVVSRPLLGDEVGRTVLALQPGER